MWSGEQGTKVYGGRIGYKVVKVGTVYVRSQMRGTKWHDLKITADSQEEQYSDYMRYRAFHVAPFDSRGSGKGIYCWKNKEDAGYVSTLWDDNNILVKVKLTGKVYRYEGSRGKAFPSHGRPPGYKAEQAEIVEVIKASPYAMRRLRKIAPQLKGVV